MDAASGTAILTTTTTSSSSTPTPLLESATRVGTLDGGTLDSSLRSANALGPPWTPPALSNCAPHHGLTVISASPTQCQLPSLSALPPGLTAQRGLRKKPKSISGSIASPPPLAHVHMPEAAGISATPTSVLPAFQSQSESDDTRPSSPGSTNRSNTPLLRTHSNSGYHRSPSQKRRPPASHSSYGVETTNGPPPSYSTQRTLSTDRVWSIASAPRINTADRDTAQLNEVAADNKALSISDLPSKDAGTPALPDSRTPDTGVSSPETADTQSLATPNESSEMTTPTTAGAASIQGETDTPGKGLGLDGAPDEPKLSSGDEHKSSEDLFLNIAKTDASRLSQPVSKSNQRRSRISLPFFSNSRPTSSPKSSPMRTQFSAADHSTPKYEAPQYFNKRSSLGGHVPGALTRSYFDDNKSQREQAFDQKSQADPVEEPVRARSRRYSSAHNDSLRPPTRSYGGRASRMVSESVYNERLRLEEPVATESTISTTAPSTVWDELDDLKSRIRKLELTGKLPPSSAAAMTSMERPRTATTTATALSTSPKHKTNLTALPSAIEGIPSTVHPLLHEALGNAKAVVSNEVFQKLQATAQDALQLSAMMNNDGFSNAGTTATLSPTAERQIRRRTESMCRSLTELAIAMLADSRGLSSPGIIPASQDTYAAAPSGLRPRRSSNEPSERPPVTSRVQSRLDSRRTSLQAGQAPRGNPSPESALNTPPPPASILPTSTSRVSRTSTMPRTRRAPGHLDGANEEQDPSPAIRPVSRAMTEGGSYRQMARDRANFSREYTKQHPLPPQVETSHSTRMPLPSNVSTNLVSRRNHASPASVVGTQDSSPITPAPRSTWGNITIERHGHSSVDTTPESGPGPRSSAGRRSMGFASRISNVGSRLRAVRAERAGQVREMASVRSPKDMAQLQQDGENQPQEERHELRVDNA